MEKLNIVLVIFEPAMMVGFLAEKKSFYSIEAPGVLRSNAEYNVVVNLFEACEPFELRITIAGDGFHGEKLVEVQPRSTEMLSFEIPDLNRDCDYYLEAESIKGPKENINRRVKLRLEQGNPLVYIQCDKQAYKRGDNVDFRVLFLEQDFLKPATISKPLRVQIKNSERTVFVESEIKSDEGLYTTRWEIPNQAIPGTYKIEVLISDVLIASKEIEVIDFTPPKFEMKIEIEKTVLYSQKQLFLGIEANHFDGTPVKGICKLEVETVAGFFTGVYIEKRLPIVGKIESTIIDLVDDLKIDHTFTQMSFFNNVTVMVKATIDEDNTDSKETVTALITIKRDDNTIDDDSLEGGCNAGGCSVSQLQSWEMPTELQSPIKIKIPEMEPTAGKQLKFNIFLNKPTKYCAYFVTARGNIVGCEFIEIQDHTKPIERTLQPNFKYVPRAFILAYFIYDGVLYSDEVGISFTKQFENKLHISVPEVSQPGLVIPLEIKTTPHSLIGVMAVDKRSVLLNAKNDLNFRKFFDDLFIIRSQIPKIKGVKSDYPGIMSGLITLSNAAIQGLEIGKDDDNDDFMFFDREHMKFIDVMPHVDPEKRKKDILSHLQRREQVFGNWLFINKKSDLSGHLKIDSRLPDNPTVWLLTAFAISPVEGFTMMEKPLEIRTISLSSASREIALKSEAPKVSSTINEFVVDNYEDGGKKISLEVERAANIQPLEVTLSITENLFGSVIENLSEHAGIMYCTGHLHMTTVIPNINVLEYLDKLNQLDSDFALSIINRFPEAIQRELSERRESDGSFCWFSNDPAGSPHVTSLVLQAFQRVSKYVDVDSSIIERGLAYLASKQLETGEIAKEENPYEYPFQKNVGVGLTSMVLLAFLQNESVRRDYKETIDRAFDYIVAHIESVNCIYDMALAFYALHLAKHPYAGSLKKRLFQIANRDSSKGNTWWSYSVLPHSDLSTKPPISELEVTSYVLLGLLESEPIEDMLPIIKWMLPPENFMNETMDRAVALDAILKFAIKSDAASAIIQVGYTAFSSEGEYSGNISLTPENSSRVLAHVLPVRTERVEIYTKSKGTFQGNLTYRHKI